MPRKDSLWMKNLVRVSAQLQNGHREKRHDRLEEVSAPFAQLSWLCQLICGSCQWVWARIDIRSNPTSLVTSGSSNGKSVSFVRALCSTVPETGEVEIMWLDDSDAVPIKGLLSTDIFAEGLTK